MADAPGVWTPVTLGLLPRFPEESVIMAVKLFVGGLAFATSSDRLRETFAVVGTVASASVVKDPTGQSRGFGFVEMETTEEATAAITPPNGKGPWRGKGE